MNNLNLTTHPNLPSNFRRNYPDKLSANSATRNTNVNWKIVMQAVREILIKTYTVDEIQAITDAYSSPVGRSIVRKQGSFLSVDELRATQKFFSTPTGQSILRKRHTVKYKMQSILKKELLKAVAKVVTEEMKRSKRTQ